MKRSMVAAWGESYSDEEQEQNEEETTHLCLMEKTEDEKELSNTKVYFNTIEEELT